VFRRLTFWFIDFGLLLILWLAFVFKLDWQEALVGTGAALLGACGAAAYPLSGYKSEEPGPIEAPSTSLSPTRWARSW
jgi:hypothetical protein